MIIVSHWVLIRTLGGIRWAFGDHQIQQGMLPFSELNWVIYVVKEVTYYTCEEQFHSKGSQDSHFAPVNLTCIKVSKQNQYTTQFLRRNDLGLVHEDKFDSFKLRLLRHSIKKYYRQIYQTSYRVDNFNSQMQLTRELDPRWSVLDIYRGIRPNKNHE